MGWSTAGSLRRSLKCFRSSIDTPAERNADGTVLQRAVAAMKVEDSEAGEAFAELFRGSPAQVEVVEDFLTAAWRKLCLNSAGVLSALTGKPAGVLRDEALGGSGACNGRGVCCGGTRCGGRSWRTGLENGCSRGTGAGRWTRSTRCWRTGWQGGGRKSRHGMG